MRLNIRDKYRKIYGNPVLKKHVPPENWELSKEVDGATSWGQAKQFIYTNRKDSNLTITISTLIDDGEFAVEYRYEGIRHREDGPAVVQYYKDGNKKYEAWSINNRPHREDGPAKIWYYENGNKEIEEWWIDNELHREDGPATIEYYENGNKQYESWYKNKEDDPVVIWYDPDGSIIDDSIA